VGGSWGCLQATGSVSRSDDFAVGRRMKYDSSVHKGQARQQKEPRKLPSNEYHEIVAILGRLEQPEAILRLLEDWNNRASRPHVPHVRHGRLAVLL